MYKVDLSNLCYKFDYLERPSQSMFVYECNNADQAEDGISFGEIILIKNIWRVQFQCVRCRQRIHNLELFLQHSLEHIYASDDDDGKRQIFAKLLAAHANEQSAEELLSLKEPEWVIPDADPLADMKTEQTNIIDLCDTDSQCENSVEVVRDAATDLQKNERACTTLTQSNANSDTVATEVAEQETFERFTGLADDTILKPDNLLTELVVTNETNTHISTEIHSSTEKTQISTHRRQRVFVCPYCKDKYISKLQFNRHIKSHGSSKPHQCDICSAAFKDRGNFNVHRRRHLGIQPHHCTQCDKRFTTTTELKIHQRSHTGEKPFACDICGIAYSSSSHLRKHKRRHTALRLPPGQEESGNSARHTNEHGTNALSDQLEHSQLLETLPDTNPQFNDDSDKEASVGAHTTVAAAKDAQYATKVSKHDLAEEATEPADDCISAEDSSESELVSSGMEEVPEVTNKQADCNQTNASDKPYKCVLCDASFKHRANFNVHRRRHLANQPQQCTECGKRFATTAELKIHFQRAHAASEKPIVCDQCGLEFSTRLQLRRHIKRHANGDLHVSGECGIAFDEEAKLTAPLTTHTHDNPTAVHSASQDPKSSIQSSAAEHTHNVSAPNVELQFNAHDISSSSKFAIIAQLPDATELEIKNEPNDYDDASNSNNDIPPHHNEVNETSAVSKHKNERHFMCPFCDKQFTVKRYFNNHLKHHGSERPHKCDLCSASFKDRRNLDVHRWRHLGIKPHECKQCNKRFTTTTELKIHHRSHTGEKPFACDICGAAYSTSSHLTSHKRRHTNERAHMCSDCGRQFYSRSHLNNHLQTHNEPRSFVCDICNASFKCKQGLRQHQQLHLPMPPMPTTAQMN